MFGVLDCISLYVWGKGECGGERGSVWARGGVCVCVCVCKCLHSIADAWAVLSAIDPQPLPYAYIHT